MKKALFSLIFLIAFKANSQDNIIGFNLAPVFDKNIGFFYERLLLDQKLGLRPFITFPLLHRPDKYDANHPVFKYNAVNIVFGGGLDIKIYLGSNERKLRYYVGPSFAFYQSKFYRDTKYRHLLVNNGLVFTHKHLSINGGFALGVVKKTGPYSDNNQFAYRIELGIGYNF